jgi:DNA (cytosine-5)-methyltransferase 1
MSSGQANAAIAENKAHTLNATHETQTVVTPFCKSKRASSPTDNETWIAGDTANTLNNFDLGDTRTTAAIVSPMPTDRAVRRLTPVECERLQGFPDNWTQIPWKGKPAEECPDGPRYKACGNSMAVPVMAWVGRRIAELEEDENA